MKQPWKERLYAAYVSSGQVSDLDVDPTIYFAPRQPYIQMVIETHLPPSKDSRILDLGCGHGAYLYFLHKAGYRNIHGVDVSAEQIALAQRLGLAAVKQADIGTYLTSVENNSVDVVLLMDILEHLTRQELFDMLDEVFRILKPDGKCISHVPNAAGLFGATVRYSDLTHELAFTPKSVQQAFTTVGFHSIGCFEDKPIPHSAISVVRRLLWELGAFPFRLLLAAETGGSLSSVLSQNMLITAIKPDFVNPTS